MKKRSLGFGFPDEIAKVTSKIGHFKKGEAEGWKDRLIPNFSPEDLPVSAKSPWQTVLFASLCLICGFIIFLRLVNLQIVHGRINKDLADGNRIQIKTIHAPRGVIYDRNGKVIAANSPAFRLFDKQNFSSPYNERKNTKKTKLISREQALELEVKNDPLADNLEIDNVRTYPQGAVLAHVLGYVGEISEDQLKSEEFKGSGFTSEYKSGDRVGKSGIEKEYEKVLRGIDGGEVIEVDSKGRKIRTLRKNAPIPGQNIYLTIDSDLQKRLFDLLTEAMKNSNSCCAAAVVSDPSNGEILALVSLPSFDPNIFTNKFNDSEIEQVFSNPHSPILNRVIGGTYPPGSTFKIVSSIAALTSGKITPQTIIQDNGFINLGIFKFTNWYFTQYGRTEGSVNLVKALQRSNDTYYYEIGRTIGEGQLIDWSRKLKLGDTLGIDLPGEVKGLIPDNEWKQKTIGEVWYPGDTLHMAIGQGFVLTTPLQVLGFTAFIASDGSLFKPHLLSKVTVGDRVISEYKKQTLISNIVKAEYLKIIKDGLSLVPKNGGTAWPFFAFPIATAGKTGTAEYGDPKNKTHAWYTAYAPVDDPKITMTVLIEAGGEGSTNASPVVKEAFRWYFSPDKNKLIQDVYTPATDSARTLGE